MSGDDESDEGTDIQEEVDDLPHIRLLELLAQRYLEAGLQQLQDQQGDKQAKGVLQDIACNNEYMM